MAISHNYSCRKCIFSPFIHILGTLSTLPKGSASTPAICIHQIQIFFFFSPREPKPEPHKAVSYIQNLFLSDFLLYLNLFLSDFLPSISLSSSIYMYIGFCTFGILGWSEFVECCKGWNLHCLWCWFKLHLRQLMFCTNWQQMMGWTWRLSLLIDSYLPLLSWHLLHSSLRGLVSSLL